MTTRKASTAPEDVNLPDDPAPITAPTMRHMHGLLRLHGHTEREDVLDVIGTVIGRQITSRSELTEQEAQRVVTAYEKAELPPDPPPGTGIYAALAAVMRDVDHVAKDSRNTQQNFSFRGVDAVVNASGPAFRKHKVIVLPVLQSVVYEAMPLASGKSATVCRLVVAYRFCAQDGSSIEAVVAAEAFDMGDKATPKAMSVAFRTALLQALALPTDEPDPDVSVYETAAHQPPQPPEREKWRPPVTPADGLDDKGTLALLLLVDERAQNASQTFEQFTEAWRRSLVTPNTPPHLVVDGAVTVDALDQLPPEHVRAYLRSLP